MGPPLGFKYTAVTAPPRQHTAMGPPLGEFFMATPYGGRHMATPLGRHMAATWRSRVIRENIGIYL